MDTRINPRSLPQEELPHPLQQYREYAPSGAPYVWPGFGWEGNCVDVSVGTDSPAAMQFCHDQGFIDHTTKTLYNDPLRAYCEALVKLDDGGTRVRAPKCAALLKRLGYPTKP